MSCEVNTANKYAQIRLLPYNIISLLLTENQQIWKLLKYNTSDALSQPDLTQDEKSLIVYSGQEDSTLYRVFLESPFLDDLFAERQCQLHIYIANLKPVDYIKGIVDVCMDVVCHNKIRTLDTYENRSTVMVQQIIETLNGVDSLGGISKFTFDYSRNSSNQGRYMYSNRQFDGFRILMSCYVSNS